MVFSRDGITWWYQLPVKEYVYGGPVYGPFESKHEATRDMFNRWDEEKAND